MSSMSSQLQEEYNAYKNQLQRLQQKIGELQSESEEHRLVLETLAATNPDRRCMRMVGGVLLDKTVKDVIPSLQETQTGLNKAVKTLQDDMKNTQTKLDDWKKKHNVKIVQQ